ncbi:MAG: hypothetical protein ABI623_04125, partial [bacterium]
MNKLNWKSLIQAAAGLLFLAVVMLGLTGWIGDGNDPGSQNTEGGTTGIKIISDAPVRETTAEIMSRPPVQWSESFKALRMKWELEQPDRSNLPQALGAIESSHWPLSENNGKPRPTTERMAPQTVSIQFDGATGPAETGAFPPDCNGAVGPTQFLVFLNGRIRTFNKSTGVADGVLNVDSDVFFNSVMTPPTSSNFTTDPNVRFDRLSGRWFLNMIDVPGGSGAIVNRVMIAVSDGATITGGTVWTYYQFTGDATYFTDYESLGIDANALYIGGNMFTTAGAFNSTKGWVIPKAPLVAASPMTVWAFPGLATTGAGAFSPRGVDNFDPTNSGPTATGYFIGVDNAVFGALAMRRVTDPGNTSVSPTISANIAVTVATTTSPNPVT